MCARAARTCRRFCTMASERAKPKLSRGAAFGTAGLGGIAGWIVVHPFNTLAVRMNLSTMNAGGAPPSFPAFAAGIVRQEGVLTLYQVSGGLGGEGRAGLCEVRVWEKTLLGGGGEGHMVDGPDSAWRNRAPGPHAQKHSEAGYGRPVDRGAWTAKTVKRPRQQPAHPQYANYWAPLTRKRHTMPHPAQSQHTNYWAPRTRKRHQQEHRPQRPTESSDPTQHAKGRTGDCPGPRKGATTRRNVTQGGGSDAKKKVVYLKSTSNFGLL